MTTVESSLELPRTRTSLWAVARYFALIGLITWGGMWTILPKLKADADERGWVPAEEFDQTLAAAMLVPGPSFVALAGLLGYRIRGAAGSAVAAVSVMLVPTVLVAAIMLFLTNSFNSGPMAPVTRTVSAAMSGVMIGNAWRILREAKLRLVGVFIFVAMSVAIMNDVSVLGCVIGGVLLGRWLLGGERA